MSVGPGNTCASLLAEEDRSSGAPILGQALALLLRPGAVGGESATSVEVAPLEHRRFSMVQRVQITTATRQFRAYVKQYRLDEPSPERRQHVRARVERDYAATVRLYDRLAEFDSVHVPRPVACFPDLLTLVVEEGPGEDLQALIERQGRGWPSRHALRTLTEYGERCGEWLGRFQTMCPVERNYPIREMWEYVDLRLMRLVSNPDASFSQSVRDQVARYFARLEQHSGGLDLRMATVHADFCPSNILVDPSGVTVLDWTMVSEGSIYQDLAQLYHQLELLQWHPAYRGHVVRGMQEALLRGYRRHLTIQSRMLEAFRLLHAVTHLLWLADSRDVPVHERWYNRRVCRRHRRFIARMTSE